MHDRSVPLISGKLTGHHKSTSSTYYIYIAMLSARYLARTTTMSSGKASVSAASTAAGRLSTIQRHLSSSSSSGGKQVERMTVFGAGLMGAGIAQVGAQNGLKVRTRILQSANYELRGPGGFVGRDGSSTSVCFPNPSSSICLKESPGFWAAKL